MKKERIFIVEDEGLVAADLESLLEELGYEVVGKAASGEEALEKIEKTRPDLVLMDIRINGPMDGIETAEQVLAQWGTPVTYLTAYADEKTLARAKVTMPYGYILKPFEEKNIRTAIELALYKHQMERMTTTIEGWHASALQYLPEAVLTLNRQGNITFLNQKAEAFLGWKLTEVFGKKPQGLVTSTPLTPPTTGGFAKASWHSKDNKTVDVSYRVSSLKNADGNEEGQIVVFHPVTS